MASINRINTGQILFDYHRTSMGNTTMTREGMWLVKVLKIDIEKRRALCSWNSNKPQWYSERELKQLKVKQKDQMPSKIRR